MSFNERIYFDSQLNFNQEDCYISKDGILRYLQTDRLIWNRNYTVPFKVKKFFNNFNNRSFVDEDGNISAFNSPNVIDITDTSTWLLPLGKYFNGEIGFLSGRGNETYRDPDTGEWGPNYWSRSIFSLKNGEQWVVQNFHNNSMVPLVDTEERPIKRLVKFGPLPNGELIYRVNEFRMYKVIVISQKGNVYFSHNYSSTINPTYIHLDKLEKVVEITPGHYWWSSSAYSYVLNEDGELFYIYGRLEQNPTPVKIEGLPRIRYDNKFLLSSGENLVVVRGEDNKFYCIYMGDIVYTWNFEDLNIVDYCYYSTWFCAVDDTGTLHGYNLTREIEGDTNESHLVVTEANWSGQTRDIGSRTVSDSVPYIRIKEDYQTIEYTSSKYTNLEYKIRFALHQNISNDGSRNVVNYVAN